MTAHEILMRLHELRLEEQADEFPRELSANGNPVRNVPGS
jgi:hypothetical protein